MVLETIKNLLGEELTTQVETALKGKGKDGKDIDIVVGNDGSYVPAAKYNEEKSLRATAEQAVKDRDKQIEDLSISTHTSLAGRDRPFKICAKQLEAFLLTRPLRDVTFYYTRVRKVTAISTHTSLAGRDR